MKSPPLAKNKTDIIIKPAVYNIKIYLFNFRFENTMIKYNEPERNKRRNIL
jgi:hypothetical protein